MSHGFGFYIIETFNQVYELNDRRRKAFPNNMVESVSVLVQVVRLIAIIYSNDVITVVRVEVN